MTPLAYDLTPNTGFFGEHSDLVNGKGAGVSDDIVVAGSACNMSHRKTRDIIDEVRNESASGESGIRRFNGE